ncbi:hypothetical protein [Burkholderia ubonensis]|uniref:hypothetical protein n=1 Tax=Burkholderia ubonensis TaxID=101571 RepID=UPI0012FB6887|nr:hypothetical protein [Burkholderia ubonensis]
MKDSTGAVAESPFGRDDGSSPLRSERIERPFGDDFAWLRESDEFEETSIVRLPRGIEVPKGYDSIDHVREAMRRAWRVEWGNFEPNSVEMLLPYRWKAIGPEGGPINIVDGSGIPRATYDRTLNAKLRLLTCCYVDQEFHPKDGHCRLVVMYRESGLIVETSYWAPEAGEKHPEWPRVQAWVSRNFPNYEDPLRCWEDCEENNENWVDPTED